jgi:hypothetical protein
VESSVSCSAIYLYCCALWAEADSCRRSSGLLCLLYTMCSGRRDCLLPVFCTSFMMVPAAGLFLFLMPEPCPLYLPALSSIRSTGGWAGHGGSATALEEEGRRRSQTKATSHSLCSVTGSHSGLSAAVSLKALCALS